MYIYIYIYIRVSHSGEGHGGMPPPRPTIFFKIPPIKTNAQPHLEMKPSSSEKHPHPH